MKSPILLLLAALQVIQPSFISAHDGQVKSKNCGLVKGYYPTYNSNKGQSVSEINFGLYTDLIFFAMTPQLNNTLSFDPVLTQKQGEQLATEFVAGCKKNGVNPLVSFGGWTSSRWFSNLTSTESARKTFANNLVTFTKGLGFTGMEIDWEYPNSAAIGCNSFAPTDTVNFGLLLKEIRTLWPEVSISAAISINGLIGADGLPATANETALLVENLNYMNLMAYDVYGPWVPTTGPIAPLSAACSPPATAQSVETGYALALKQGFKPEQIVLGIPGYAKRLELVSPKLEATVVNGKTSYYYQNHTSVTPQGGAFDDKPGVDICGANTTWGGSFLAKELISNGWLSEDQKTGKGGYTRYFDDCSGMPFLTNGKYFISYDDRQSTVGKAKFAKDKNLAGIFFFDTQGPTDDTIKAARKVIS